MSNVIKVLQFPIRNTNGGITKYAMNNWKFINKNKFHFDFATLSPCLDFENVLTQQGCQVLHIQHTAEENAKKFYDEFRHILRQGHYDIVHLHTSFWKSLWAERATLDEGLSKIILHAHNTNVQAKDEDEQRIIMEQHIKIRNDIDENDYDGYWACSKMAADFLYGDKIASNRIHIMHNAIDLQRFSFKTETRTQIRRELGLTENDFVVGHIGLFLYQKNQEFLLKVIKVLKKYTPHIKLLLAGKGERLQLCRQYVRECGMDNTVIFTGYREDIERVMCAFDLFVLPSRFEGLPFVLIEAQANGLLCYASDTTTTESKVSDNIEYLPLDEGAWIDRIVEAYKLKNCRRDVMEQVAQAGYDLRKQIKVVEQGYVETLGGA